MTTNDAMKLSALKTITPDSFVKAVKGFEGQPYCWPDKSNNYSGKGLETSDRKDCHDCSGTVTDGLYIASDRKLDLRSTVNAQGLYNISTKIQVPSEGDLAFYGKGPSSVSHVMVVMDGQRVYGASGGNHTTLTLQDALKANAFVRYEKSYKYRADFVSFGRILTTKQDT